MDLGGFGNAQNIKGGRPVGKEEAQKVSFELMLPKGLMLDQEKPFPDGAVWVEGDEEGEDLAFVSLKKKKNNVIKAVSLSAALVLLLAVTGWMAYKKVLAPPLKPPLPGPPGVDEKIVRYSIELLEKRNALDLAWVAASENVKRVFARSYMPSMENEHVPVSSALSYYKLQVLEMSKLQAPEKTEEIAVKKQHLHKQMFLCSLLDAAVHRLEELRHMEEDTERPALILDHEKTTGQAPQGNVAVGLFIEELNKRGFEYKPSFGLGKEEGVSWAKVNEFFELLEMEERFVAFDKKAHEAFNLFLEGYGLSLKDLRLEDMKKMEEIKLPRDETTVDVKTFLGFLKARYDARDVANFREELLNELVAEWSETKLLAATKAVKDHHKKSLEDLLRQKRILLEQAREKQSPVPLTHGFPLAVFLA